MKLFPPDAPELLEKLRELEDEDGVKSTSQSNPSWSPLHWFAAKNDARRVSAQAHVMRGVDPSVQNDVGDTPLHIAVWRQDESKVDWLLALGARLDVANKKGNLPLHQALRKSNLELAIKLLEGVDLAAQDTKGVSAIGHWVQQVGEHRKELFGPGTAGDQVWRVLRNADRAAWARWQDKLSDVFLADLRRYRLEEMEGCLPEATKGAARPRF